MFSTKFKLIVILLTGPGFRDEGICTCVSDAGIFANHNCIGPNRSGDMSDFLLPHILKGVVDPVQDLIVDITRYTNSTEVGQSFQPGRNIAPFSVNVAAAIGDVTHVNAHAEIQWAGG